MAANKKNVTKPPLREKTVHFVITPAEDKRLEDNQKHTVFKARAQFLRVLIDEALSAREAKRDASSS